LLIGGGVAAVGVAYFSTRGAGGGSRIGNLAVGGLMLAGLGYGIYTYMKAPEIVTEEPTAQQSSTLSLTAKQRRNFKLQKWAMGQVQTKVGVSQQCGGRMTLEQQRECEAQFTAFSGSMSMPLGSTGNS
jgi:disulfide bond formation protein DsbB